MEQIGDMYLAAALLSYGASLSQVDKSNLRRQKFFFEDVIKEIYVMDGSLPLRVVSPSIKSVEMYFVSKRLMFPPTYPDCLRSIKSSIHSEER